MNLEELKQRVDFIYETNRYPEFMTVCVTTSETSAGGRAFSIVNSIHSGIDWENNQIRIETEHKLVKQKEVRE